MSDNEGACINTKLKEIYADFSETKSRTEGMLEEAKSGFVRRQASDTDSISHRFPLVLGIRYTS